MVEESVHLHLGKNEGQPQNRKQVYLMWEKKLTETENLSERIDCIQNSIMVALADIPAGEYNPEDLFKCKPKYKDIKKQFFKDHNILVPEMEMALQPHINREFNMIWEDRLKKERQIIIELLTQYTDWYFDTESYEAPTM